MKYILALLVLVAHAGGLGAQDAPDFEGTRVASVEVSGIDRGSLSPGLRRDIEGLVDSPYDADAARRLATRIEQEQPEFVAALRIVPFGPEGDVEVIFLAARISDDRDLESNINARYIVESVELSGIDEAEVSAGLLVEMQSLVGARLDTSQAEGIEDRLETELSGYTVRRRIERGNERGWIRLVFDVEKAPWIPFRPSRSMIAYHSRQGYSGVIDIGLSPRRRHRVTLGGVLWNNEDLIEEYAGYRLGYENRFLGTERLGVRIEYSSFRQKWRKATLDAMAPDPGVPGAYRERQSIETDLTFAFSPSLRARVGASFNAMESHSMSPESETANAAVVAISYDREWEGSGSDHSVQASYEIRSGTRVLESDLVYTRHFGEVRFAFSRGPSAVTSDFLAGRLTERAPLYERFALDNVSTLRG
jgi:hypothetical protein